MNPIINHKKSRLIRKGGQIVCICYLLGLFNGVFLEITHEVSHWLFPQTQHHTFLDHSALDVATLQALAGHSHDTLQALEELLMAESNKDQSLDTTFQFELDKHITVFREISYANSTHLLQKPPDTSAITTSIWSCGVPTPPPQNSWK